MAQIQDQEASSDGPPRRRSRAAAAQAKHALSMLTESDDVERGGGGGHVTPSSPSHAVYGRPRGRGRGRGRPPGSVGMSVRRRPMGYDARVGRPRQTRTTDILPEDESSLYFIIRNGKASLQQVVDDWIDAYKVGFEIPFEFLV